MAENVKKLYKSRTNKMLGGVCGGLAEYFGVDPTLMRVIYLILTLLTGVIFGVVVYVILAIIIPWKPGKS